MLSRPVNVALVENQALLAKILKNYLSQHENLNVIFQADNMSDLLDKMKDHPIDILVMDIFIPPYSGSDGLKIIRKEYPEVRILILSVCTDLNLISDLLKLGIYGYISKSDEPEELLKAIQSVSEDKIYRNRIFTHGLYFIKKNTIKYDGSEILSELDERDKKILQLLWEERTNKEIADELFIGVRTVEKIRQAMKEKLGVRSTVGLFKFGIREKILQASLE